MPKGKPKKGASARRGGGVSHQSCSKARERIKERIRAVEATNMTLQIAYDSLLNEIRDLMQGQETVISEKKQL